MSQGGAYQFFRGLSQEQHPRRVFACQFTHGRFSAIWTNSFSNPSTYFQSLSAPYLQLVAHSGDVMDAYKTKPSASVARTTRVCLESGQKRDYHHAGTHPVGRVVAPVREVIHSVFPVSANYLRRFLVPSTHKRHQPMVPRIGHEIKGGLSLSVSMTRRARGGRQPQPPSRRESRALAGRITEC